MSLIKRYFYGLVLVDPEDNYEGVVINVDHKKNHVTVLWYHQNNVSFIRTYNLSSEFDCRVLAKAIVTTEVVDVISPSKSD